MKGFLLTLAIVAATAVVPTGAGAQGGLTCTYDAGEHEMNIVLTDSNVSSYGMRVDSAVIYVANDPCTPSATVEEVDTIKVDDTGGASVDITIEIAEPFAPGFTNEPGGSDEIEFIFNSGDGEDSITIRGDSAGTSRLKVRAGRKMVEGLKRNVLNLNAGEATGIDHDVVLNGVENILMEGDKRADVLGAQGGAATGKSTTLPVRLVGDLGKDKLTGSRFGDLIEGGGAFCSPCKGRKVIKGMGGPDEISGGDGRNRILGGKGNDEILGKKANDRLFGNAGRDKLEGAQGDDKLDGGPNVDNCKGGPGSNTITNCE